MMDEDRRKQASANLVRAVMTPTDDLAAKKGEGNALVQIKRNSDRLAECDRHEFEPVPDWRDRPGPFIWQKVRCSRCGGEMRAGEVHDYLRGFAHGSGRDYTALANAIWPPGDVP